MSLSRRDIDAFAQTVLGRRLSPAELDDLVRQSRLVNLRAGDDVYLLDLVRHRDLITRVETIARRAAENLSIASAIRRLRIWIVAMTVLAVSVAWVAHLEGYLRGYDQRDRMVAKEVSWTTTPSGHAARVLHDTGFAKRIRDCDIPGWVQIGSQCRPGVDPRTGQMYGIINRLEDEAP